MMKVFLSWSGPRSMAVAKALQLWLPQVIQAVEPWLSSEDIPKGAGWLAQLTRSLAESKIGIICLTSDNVERPWLNFEAGAMSNSAEGGLLVCPFLFDDLKPSALKGPIAQFQATQMNAGKEDMLKLLSSINETIRKSGGRALEAQRLKTVFEKWWPDIEEEFKKVPKAEVSQNPPREFSDILEEILSTVRRQEAMPGRGSFATPVLEDDARRHEMRMLEVEREVLQVRLAETREELRRAEVELHETMRMQKRMERAS